MTTPPWIKMRTDLGRDPAVIQIAEQFEIEEHEVVGLLHKLWSWADEQVADGNARGVTFSYIDRYIKRTGFARMLAKVGWLDETDGGVVFPKWERHMSKSAKRRAVTAKRVCNARGVTKSVQDLSLKERSSIGSKREGGGGSRGGKFDARCIEIPSALGPEFEPDWYLWCNHRSEIRKPLTRTQAEQQIRQFAEWGADRASAAIRHTVTKGWQGIREPELNGQTKKPALRIPE